MTLATIATFLILLLLLIAPAFAAPGDPRFVQGTLEWPSTLTREPVIIVRGDDGNAYYCDVTDAARHRADGLRAGSRVSVLGIEAARPHELTSIVVGTGDAAALARALSQSLAKQAPAPPAAVPQPTALASPPAAPASAPVAPASVPAAEQTPAPSAAPAVVIMAPSTPVMTAAPPVALAPTAAVVPATVTTPAVATTPAPARRTIVPATPAAATGRGQWSRLDGMVESVAGSTLTLKMDDGAQAYVDISQLSPNVAQVLRRGTAVTVYGYPLEQKFEAAGYIQTHTAGPEPGAQARPAR
jgi:hypothetical protein